MFINRRSGFTLLETLVTISVIAILLGITIPALRAVVRSASSVACRNNLNTIGRYYALYASQNGDMWPNALLDFDPLHPEPLDVKWGFEWWDLYPGDQIQAWAWPLRDYVPGDGPDAWDDVTVTPSERVSGALEIFTCPVVLDMHFSALSASSHEVFSRPGYATPIGVSSASYRHSAALFTQAEPWHDRGNVVDLDFSTGVVRHSDVAFPSRKAALVESHTHHEKNHWADIDNRPAGAVNLLGADGHVETRAVADAAPPHRFTVTYTFDPPGPYTVPYVSTHQGFLGRDW